MYRRVRATIPDANFEGVWSVVNGFTVDTDAAPNSPVNVTVNVPRPQFTWSVGTATDVTYDIQVSSDSGSTWTIIATDIDATGYTPLDYPLQLDNHSYQWLLRTREDGFLGEWSSAVSFDLDTRPTTSAPTDGEVITTPGPNFSWTGGFTGGAYDLQVATDSGFNTTTVDETGLTAASYDTGATPLSDGTYYWQIRATSSDSTSFQGAWRSGGSFTMDGSPTGLAPTGTINTLQPVISWTEPFTGATYDLGSNNEALADGDYIYRVRAYGSNGYVSNWTGGSFTVDAAPTGLSPSGTVNTLQPVISWSSPFTGAAFDLEITSSGDSSYTSSGNYPGGTGLGSSSFDLSAEETGLDYGDYIYRVRSKAAGKSSNWTGGSLTVDARPTSLSVASLTSDNTPEFSWTEPFGAASTDVEVYSDSGMSNLTDSTTVTGSVWSPASAFSDGSYYWQARTTITVTAGTFTSDWVTGSSVEIDTTAPSVDTAMSIQSGNTYAHEETVSISVTISDQQPESDLDMRISEAGDFSTGTGWITYQSSYNFDLSSYNYSQTGEDNRTVYVQYRDNLGNTTSSSSDTITFDPHVYLSDAGSDSNSGDKDNPLQTLAAAFTLAETRSTDLGTNLVDVRIDSASGTPTFDLGTTGVSTTKPISLLGKYNSTFSARDQTNPTITTTDAVAISYDASQYQYGDGWLIDGITITSDPTLASDGYIAGLEIKETDDDITVSNVTINMNGEVSGSATNIESYQPGSAGIYLLYNYGAIVIDNVTIGYDTLSAGTYHGSTDIGSASTSSKSVGSAGVDVVGSTDVTIQNSTIEGGNGIASNSNNLGSAGIFGYNSTVTIQNNTSVSGGIGDSDGSNYSVGSAGIGLYNSSYTISGNTLIEGGSGSNSSSTSNGVVASAGIGLYWTPSTGP